VAIRGTRQDQSSVLIWLSSRRENASRSVPTRAPRLVGCMYFDFATVEVLNSDAAPSSDLTNYAEQEREKAAERRRLQNPSSSRPRSSSRLRGPPSESAAAQSDAGAYFDDEQIQIQRAQRLRAAGQRSDIPRVVDSVGEGVARAFEHFLET
jgi:hypothetical protein